MDSKVTFSKNLNKYMKENGKTRKEVCEALGFSYYTFSDWVNGKKFPRMDSVEKLAKYFGILKSDLIEEHLDGETSKKIDVATDILIRMEKDKDFTELVNKLYKMDSAKIKAVKALLDSFSE